MALSPIALYIHIPFCQTKCPYCAFYKEIWHQSEEDAFLLALEKEMGYYSSHFGKQRVKSVFLGGGTPSKLSSSNLERLVTLIHTHFSLEEGFEFTTEANPESISKPFLETFSTLGGNRISLGVQSFNDVELKFLGRTHSVTKVHDALSDIKTFSQLSLNIDLIIATPVSTEKSLTYSLDQALKYTPEHLSTYTLTIEPNTPFELKRVKTLPSQEELNQYQLAVEIITQTGYHHYEISAFAQPSKECVHNLAYWQFEDFIGLGPSGSSLFQNQRYTQISSLTEYLKNPIPPILREPTQYQLDFKTQITEFVLSHFRLLSGVPLKKFETCFGASIHSFYGSEILKLKKKKLIVETETHLKATLEGLYLLNDILIEFV